jgi:hypothetical protein
MINYKKLCKDSDVITLFVVASLCFNSGGFNIHEKNG